MIIKSIDRQFKYITFLLLLFLIFITYFIYPIFNSILNISPISTNLILNKFQFKCTNKFRINNL